ncbi:MAG: hypothetical protein WBF09_13135 [Candidatus Acidiferrum sp.]
MNYRFVRLVRYGALALAVAFPAYQAAAQDASSLEGQLTAKYKLVKLGSDSTGVAVIEAGTILDIKKGGIMSYPTNNPRPFASVYKDGTVHPPSSMKIPGWMPHASQVPGQVSDTKFLTVGEKVYATRIEVQEKDSKVAVFIIECDSCNNVQDPSFRRAQVVFQFPKGYLSNADAGQISDLIEQVLSVDTGGDSSQQQGQDTQQGQQQGQQQGNGQQQAAPADQQPAAAPAGPPPTIQLGQTTDEVIAIMGQPDKIVDLKTKQIYVYKDLKVTFVKGKVSDVE